MIWSALCAVQFVRSVIKMVSKIDFLCWTTYSFLLMRCGIKYTSICVWTWVEFQVQLVIMHAEKVWVEIELINGWAVRINWTGTANLLCKQICWQLIRPCPPCRYWSPMVNYQPYSWCWFKLHDALHVLATDSQHFSLCGDHVVLRCALSRRLRNTAAVLFPVHGKTNRFNNQQFM